MGVILLIAGLASAAYGVSVMLVNSGSPFYLIWYALALVLAGTGILALTHAQVPAIRALARIVGACFAVGVLVVGAASAFILSAAWNEPDEDLDCLIVLGAQVRADGTPAESLRYRLESALAYLDEHPSTKVVVSGGQGANEPCPEAHAMRAWLVEHGVDEDRILVEDRSTTTAENIAYSSEFIDPVHDRVGIVTNDFHVFRALAIARRGGIERVWGVPARSHPWYLPNNLLRECFAIAKNALLGTM